MAIEWQSAAVKASAGRLTEAQARAVLNSIMEHAGQEPITFYKTRDWLNQWLEDMRLTREPSTNAKYKQVIDRFLDHLGPRANKGLAHIGPAEIRSFRDHLQREGRAASTVNQIISKVLSSPLAKAVRLGYIPLNPCAAVGPLKETSSEASVFTLEQLRSLVDNAPSPDWRGMILAGFFTGQRLRDLADLSWSQVDLPKQMIFIESQRKTKASVAIPIHQDLLSHLLQLAAPDDPKSAVFPSIYGKAGSGKSGLSEAFKRIMVKGGSS
jgi:integrase